MHNDLIKIIVYCPKTIFAESMFPKATGLKYIADGGADMAVICRNNKYVEPQGGWFIHGTYVVIEAKEPGGEIPRPDSKKCKLLNMHVRSFYSSS